MLAIGVLHAAHEAHDFFDAAAASRTRCPRRLADASGFAALAGSSAYGSTGGLNGPGRIEMRRVDLDPSFAACSCARTPCRADR